ncbi:MAG: flp pilus-assembly TadE/G-like family protein [Nocardioides sp.]|nr:flp pilus-assembly TadE/G-like family protein [Nocardioides sp.]
MTGRVRRAAGRRTDEHGAAAAYAVGLVAVLVVASVLLTLVATVFVGRREAEKAADLAALSGAQAHQAGRDPCARAELLTRRNGAHLTSCTVDGADVLVEVEVRGSRLLSGLTVPGRARAGPGR